MKIIRYTTEKLKEWESTDYMWWLLVVPCLTLMGSQAINAMGVPGVVITIVQAIMYVAGCIGLLFLAGWILAKLRKG